MGTLNTIMDALHAMLDAAESSGDYYGEYYDGCDALGREPKVPENTKEKAPT